MPRRIRLQASFIGGDVSNVDIFHTTGSAQNRLAQNIATGSLLDPGVEVDAPDSATHFFARVIGGVCALVTGSLDVANNDVTKRFFTFKSADQDGNTTNPNFACYAVSDPLFEDGLGSFGFGNDASLNVAKNYEDGGQITITASPVYPYTFVGFYSGSTLLSATSPLTITVNDYTGSNTSARDVIIARAGTVE